ncbi:LPXTG cell wall anchor domain-containing protein [Streptacidiphilus sp. PAMC 29251]
MADAEKFDRSAMQIAAFRPPPSSYDTSFLTLLGIGFLLVVIFYFARRKK